MEVHVLIVEFVFGSHCILTQGQVKPELPHSPQLLHHNTIIATDIPSIAKSTIARRPFERYVPALRSDSIFSGNWVYISAKLSHDVIFGG